MLIFEPDPPLLRWCAIAGDAVVEGVWSAPSEDTAQTDSGAITGEDAAKIERAIAVGEQLEAVVYVLAHGGNAVTSPLTFFRGSRFARDTPAVTLDDLVDCLRFWPDSNQLTLDAARAWLPRLPQVPHIVACDTGFFAVLPAVAATYALPAALRAEGFRRYGSHGFCHAWTWQETTRRLGEAARRIVSVHIGDRSDVAAICDGLPLETTTGFTPTEGILSATRSGDIDPEVALTLRASGMKPADVADVLGRRSGLSALLGRPCGLLDILGRDDPAYALARGMLVYGVLKGIGAAMAAMGGADALVFTHSVGPAVNGLVSPICHALEFLDVKWVPGRGDATGAVRLTDGDSALQVLSLPYNRRQVIADQVRCFLAAASKGPVNALPA